jgi:hypothetical protein
VGSQLRREDTNGRMDFTGRLHREARNLSETSVLKKILVYVYGSGQTAHGILFSENSIRHLKVPDQMGKTELDVHN